MFFLLQNRFRRASIALPDLFHPYLGCLSFSMRKRFTLFLFGFFVFHSAFSQTSLSKTERKIAEAIDKEMPYTLNLLKESVNINSGTLNIAGVKQVGEMYRKELAALGFTTEWIAMPDSLKRAGHLVAYKKAAKKKGKRLFLIGHLDTVFEPDMTPNPFTLLNDSTATGQGINDMKGGDVMVIAALKALQQQGLLKDATITVYFTGDEENAGNPKEVSRGDFISRAKNHDVALAFETGSMGNVTVARRGASTWRLEAEGKQAHSSGIFGQSGYGAVYEAARILNEFREKLRQEYLTYNPAIFAGGTEVTGSAEGAKYAVSGKANIISPTAVVEGDLRFLRESQKDSARGKMSAIVSANNLPGTSAKISFKDGIPSMPPREGNMALAKMMNDASLSLGFGPVEAGNPGARGAGDISYVAQFLDCLDGIGASGRGAHAPGETMSLNEYPKLIKRAALLMYRLVNEKNK
jgi:glutamate carboxypeptidase